MIVAIERNKFTYLYKYNQIRVDINQVIDEPVENLKCMLQSDFSKLIQLFNKAIPLFEQDHEIILLEVDKSKIKIHDGMLLSFDSILCIYPLTIIGQKLLEGKINDNFIMELPVFEKCLESLIIIRSMEFRKSASKKLLAHFALDTFLNEEIISAIEEAIKKNLLDKNQHQVFTTFLDHLIAYNKTPSYIPEGNIEHICKIGAIAIKYLGKSEEVFTNGPFYKSILKYKSKINNKSYLVSYLDFILIADDDLKTSYEKMLELISKDYKEVDIFKVSYFFLAFKSFLNKHDNNIELLNKDINTLILKDKNTAAMVMAMLGYTFSFENIYEGIHGLCNAPLLKSTIKKKAAELEKEKIEKAATEQKRDSTINFPDPSIEKKTIKGVIEKIEEPIITNPIETFTEAIVIYEVNEPQTKDDKETINIKDDKAQQEEQIINVDKELEEKLSKNELLTVHVFRSYLSKEQTKPKQKIWFDLLEKFFPSRHEEISLESLLDKLDTVPEVKDKILKAPKDKKAIKAFFDTYK